MGANHGILIQKRFSQEPIPGSGTIEKDSKGGGTGDINSLDRLQLKCLCDTASFSPPFYDFSAQANTKQKVPM